MKHYTRKERRIRRGGYDEGYIAGYKQGLHDGNPFIAIAEAATKAVNSLAESFADPEFQEVCRKYLEERKEEERETDNLCDDCKIADDCTASLKGLTGCKTTKCFRREWADKEEENDTM